MTTKFLEIKFCKTCKENLNYKKFRKDKLNLAGSKCPDLGVDMEIFKLGSINNDLTQSIDRIYPKKGYVKGNIVVVSMRANRIKTDATVDKIRKVGDFYEKLLKDK